VSSAWFTNLSRRRAVTRVGNAHQKIIYVGLKRDVHASTFARRLRMLNSIGDQFVHDESERHRDVSGNDERIGIDDNRPRSVQTARCGCNSLTKTNIIIFMKLFVNEGNCGDPSSRVVKLTCSGPCCFCLQMQEARDNLQAVLDAVIDLFQQQVFLPPTLLK
jgi:hypothetical protein